MNDVYPKAVKTLAQVREGYARGGFLFADVQDAADNIIQMQAQWAEAMTTYRDALAEIDRLTGRFDAAPLAETNRRQNFPFASQPRRCSLLSQIGRAHV